MLYNDVYVKLIVGLGNPGEKYKNTRHNIGFMALDTLLGNFEPLKHTSWEDSNDPTAILKKQKKTFAHTKRVKREGEDVILAKPATFMNNSGFAVTHLLSFYKIKPEDLIVIYDDSDLPLGKIRVRFGGAGGGHHGVENIIEQIESDKFLRLRLGIGRPRNEKLGKTKHTHLDKYVLGHFEPKDKHIVKHMLSEAGKNIELILKHGLEIYMSKYNKS